MLLLRAIILGLVQGLTEFLPVSSSGHLVVVPYLLGWEPPPLAFDVALHAGTLLAVMVYFAGDLWWLATRTLGLGSDDPDEIAKARRSTGLLALGTLPAVAAGFFLEQFFEATFAHPERVAGFLVVTGALLLVAERLRRRRAARALSKPLAELSAEERLHDPGRSEGTTGWLDVLMVGLAQALAILPGISRSGATIAAGMVRGLSRQAAARLSFLLAIPVILGATVLKAGEIFSAQSAGGAYGTSATIAGVIAAAASGFWAIRYLLRLVVVQDLLGFARYVSLLGVLTYVGTLWIGAPSSV